MRANLPSIAALSAGALALTHGRAHPRRMGLFRNEPVFERNVHLRIPLGTTLAAAVLLAAGGFLLSKTLRRGSSSDLSSSTVEESIELDVPVSTAYNQWTQFEEFPKFMASVESVTQIDDTHLHWRALVGGKIKEWDAEITEQIPDKRIAWRSIGGVPNGGVVTFHKLSDTRTRVMLQMEYTPQSIGEKLGDAIGAVKLTAKGNLKKFKHLVEARGVETGGWRGSVAQH
jgi:uncharacterized membrane protein